MSEDAADTVLDLSATFADVDIATNADSLTLSVTANTNPSLVTATMLGSQLTLDYQLNQNGSSLVTIRATDLVDNDPENADRLRFVFLHRMTDPVVLFPGLELFWRKQEWMPASQWRPGITFVPPGVIRGFNPQPDPPALPPVVQLIDGFLVFLPPGLGFGFEIA